MSDGRTGTARSQRILMEALGLQSPRGRLMVFTVLSVAVLLAPYEWLAHLSIWQALGIPSPSIGLTRAYHLLLHGDVAGAWQRNPLIFLVLAIGLPMLAFDAGRVFQQWRARHRPYPAKK